MSVKRTTWSLLLVLGTAAAAFCPDSVLAQPAMPPPTLVKWRYDYNLARREALKRKLPIIIDFFKDQCPYCVIQDNSTFRDPQIVNLVNDNFIPLKINGEVEVGLRDALKITSYPTIVLAAHDGKIMQPLLIGLQKVPELNGQLQFVLGALTEPEWMLRDYHLAGTMMQNREFARAIATLLHILEDGKSRSVQLNARKLLQDLEAQGQERLGQARESIDRGKVAEGIEVINDTMRTYAGLQAAKDGSTLLARVMQSPEIRQQQRAKRAQELLAQAQDFYKTKDHIPCLDRCEILMASYGDMPQSQTAYQLAASIKNDPKFMQAACDTMSDRLGNMWIALADTMLREGQPDRARYYFERIIHAFPGTGLAERAEIRLNQLTGTAASIRP